MKKIFLLFVSVFMIGCMAYGETGKVVHVTKSEFVEKIYDYEKNPDKWVYKGNKPAIVDFYADWCGPCRRLSPVLEKLAAKYKDQIVIYKVNTDKERELAAAFIPVDGQPQASQGALPEEILEKGIKEVLLK